MFSPPIICKMRIAGMKRSFPQWNIVSHFVDFCMYYNIKREKCQEIPKHQAAEYRRMGCGEKYFCGTGKFSCLLTEPPENGTI